VGRIDEHGLARRAVANSVHEVHHLSRDRVVGGEIATGQHLAEVELRLGHAPTLRRRRSKGTFGGSVRGARSEAAFGTTRNLAAMTASQPLLELSAGQLIPFGG